MRGFPVGESSANFEIVPSQNDTGELRRTEIAILPPKIASTSELAYEFPEDDPTTYLDESGVTSSLAEIAVVPTISEDNEPTGPEKDALADEEIRQFYEDIEREKQTDRLFAEIVQGAKLNKEGYLSHPEAADQDDTELTLPAIQTETVAIEAEQPRDNTSLVATPESNFSVDLVVEPSALIDPVEVQPPTETLSPIEVLTETIMSIHDSVSKAESASVKPALSISSATENTANNAVVDPTIWEPAFGYSYDIEGVPQDSTSEDNKDQLDLELSKPVINPNSLLGRLGQWTGVFEKEPAALDTTIYPTHVQSALDEKSNFINSAPEVASESTAWLEKTDVNYTVEVENNTPEVAELPVTKLEAEETNYLAQDEADIEAFLKETMEQFTDEEPEIMQPKLVAVPQSIHEHPASAVDEVATIEVPTAQAPEATDIEPASLPLSHEQRTLERWRKEVQTMRLLDLSEAPPLEVARVAAKDSISGRQLDLFIQKIVDDYNGEHSVDAIWKMYCDGNIRADGTIMDPIEQDSFNKLLIDSLEFIDDSQPALVA